jgi:hypothetical protein
MGAGFLSRDSHFSFPLENFGPQSSRLLNKPFSARPRNAPTISRYEGL